jgi:hypothetical protein
MLDSFRLGGWGMYATLIAGLVALLVAIQYARRPEAGRLLVVSVLGVLTFLAGSLGFVAGLIKSISIAQGDAGTVLEGFGESLHNIGLALSLLVIVAITTAIGAGRSSGLRPRFGEAPTLGERPRGA